VYDFLIFIYMLFSLYWPVCFSIFGACLSHALTPQPLPPPKAPEADKDASKDPNRYHVASKSITLSAPYPSPDVLLRAAIRMVVEAIFRAVVL
jgi:hypothetical protein